MKTNGIDLASLKKKKKNTKIRNFKIFFIFPNPSLCDGKITTISTQQFTCQIHIYVTQNLAVTISVTNMLLIKVPIAPN